MRRLGILFLWAGILLSTEVFGSPFLEINATQEIEAETHEDALGKWLENFDTYTLMGSQDLDISNTEESSLDIEITEHEQDYLEGEGDTEGLKLDYLEGEQDTEELEQDYSNENEDDNEGSSAPITLIVKNGDGLLNPQYDYEVILQSLVVGKGSVFLTLETFRNKSSCGVGGFSYPSTTSESEGTELLNITQQMDGKQITTFVAFATKTDTNGYDNAANSSKWTMMNVGSAVANLTGGGLLSLSYTPPECGCLMIKSYYALPIGDDLTLVVEPEAYPGELEKLLCIDPSSESIEDNLIEDEDDDDYEEEELLEEGSLDESEQDAAQVDGEKPVKRGRAKWLARKRANLLKKKQRQQARKAIRKAGKRVTKKRVQQHLRHRRGDESIEESARKPGVQKAAPKKARKARKLGKKNRKVWKGKKPWKKHRKFNRKHRNGNKHRRRNRQHGNRNATEGMNATMEEDFDADLNITDTEPETAEDELADLFLSDEEADEDPSEVEDGEETTPSTRRGRKQRKQRKRNHKQKNKGKKKGGKFCCKQGIKYKKTRLLLDGHKKEEDISIQCNTTGDIVLTFAAHQFNIDSEVCSNRYETCCSKFTLHQLENVKAKKSERKAKRKQQRKAVRKQKRRQNRRQRGSSTTPSP